MIKTLKKFTAFCLLFGSFFSPNLAWPENTRSPKDTVKEMIQAQSQLNYQISFVQTNATDLKTFRYKHTNVGNKIYAQLSSLNGPRQDIIRRDNLVSYFPFNYSPFTIQSNQIVDYLPHIMNVNIDKLEENYDFFAVGRNRVADRLTQVIKVIPKDNFRYQYVIFIDENTHLLLRSDMLDREGDILESFQVLDLILKGEEQEWVSQLGNFSFPPLSVDDKEKKSTAVSSQKWAPQWLPKGFKLIKEKSQLENGNVVSQLYSDGLFSFALYVADKIADDNKENLWYQHVNTIYTKNIGEKEVTLIGQVPANTAKRIVQDIKFN